MEIRRYTTFEAFCLSYVYNNIVFIVELVTTWLLRHALYDAF